LSRGAAYLKMGKMDEAIRDFTRTIASDRKNARAWYYRGTAYLSKEDLGHAAVDFDKTIALNPDYGAAYFGRGTIYSLMGEDEQASRYIKTAIIKSETEIQGFADVFGISRTQFEKAMAHLSGERTHDPTLMLTEEEIETVKEWMDAA
jgi:tetratricopeptide (TPR) repeat protein